jgi:oligopeptide transport system ATP-binding protein
LSPDATPVASIETGGDKPPLLTIEELSLVFRTYVGDVQALDHVNLEVRQGETLGLVGESGCGKSVTAMSILRLNPSPPAVYTGGHIRFEKRDGAHVDILNLRTADLHAIRGNEISMIFQEPMTSLNPVMPVGEQIVEALLRHRSLGYGALSPFERALEARKWRVTPKLRGRHRKALAIARDMLKKIGLPDPATVTRRYPHELSGGMRQRIMIAMALATEPRLLIADEPTTALDVTIQAQIMQLMRDLKRDQNASILLITHHLGIIAEMCERVAVMYAGTIAETGSVHDIFYKPAHPYTVGLLKSIPSLRTSGDLPSIRGSVPDLLNPPAGCRFHPRCPYAMPECLLARPPLFHVGPDHNVACYLYDGDHDIPADLREGGIGSARGVPKPGQPASSPSAKAQIEDASRSEVAPKVPPGAPTDAGEGGRS